MKFIAQAGDRGGYNALKPVLELALADGHEVALYLSATCARLRQEGKLPLIAEIDNISRIHIFHPGIPLSLAKPDICVVGASQSDEGSTAAREIIQQSGKPTVLIEDYYGSSLPTLAHFGQLNVPHYLHVCVGDELAKSNVVGSHLMNLVGGDASERVHVTGLPQYQDLISRIKPRWQEIRTKIRQTFGIGEQHLVFLIAGQLNGTAEAIATVCLSLQRLPQTFGYLLVRQHPRATVLDRWITRRMVDGADRDLPGPYCFIMDEDIEELPPELASQTEMLLPAADFVISGYATTLRYAAICGITGTISLGTPSFVYDLKREKGLTVPPEATAGVVWHAKDDKELAYAISRVKVDPSHEEVQRIKENQAKMAALNDGQAARRILDLVVRLAQK